LTETNFHYISPLFKFEENAEAQYFSVLPNVVLGKYLKVEFYGKPVLQEDINNKHYIAIQKVALFGCPISNTDPRAKSIPEEILPSLHETYENCAAKFEHETNQQTERDRITEEEFTFVEESLVKLISGEISLFKFMDNEGISDLIDWIEK